MNAQLLRSYRGRSVHAFHLHSRVQVPRARQLSYAKSHLQESLSGRLQICACAGGRACDCACAFARGMGGVMQQPCRAGPRHALPTHKQGNTGVVEEGILQGEQL